jgi:hypothetical protein
VIRGRRVVWDITTPANSSFEISDTYEERTKYLPYKVFMHLAGITIDPQEFVGELGFSFSLSLRCPQLLEFSNPALNPLNPRYETLSKTQELPLDNQDLPQLFAESRESP